MRYTSKHNNQEEGKLFSTMLCLIPVIQVHVRKSPNMQMGSLFFVYQISVNQEELNDPRKVFCKTGNSSTVKGVPNIISSHPHKHDPTYTTVKHTLLFTSSAKRTFSSREMFERRKKMNVFSRQIDETFDFFLKGCQHWHKELFIFSLFFFKITKP